MMNKVFLPALGETMTEARIVSWLKNVGDPVKKGEPIFEIETDKATLEVEALASGYLSKVVKPAGELVPVGEVVAYLGDEAGSTLPEEADGTWTGGTQQVDAGGAQISEPLQAAVSRRKKLVASPRARRLADRHSLDISLLADQGSGGGGRIIERDVQRYLDGQQPIPVIPAPVVPIQAPPVFVQAPVVPEEDGDRVIPLAGMRKAIAEQMVYSVQHAPHITFSEEVDLHAAQAWRERVNQIQAKAGLPSISWTALIAKATAWALSRHPWLNASLQKDQIVLHKHINLGIAVALDAGLIVPVVHDAFNKGIARIAAEIAELSERARANRLQASQLAAGTFTISNLGMYGSSQFTAILNPPQAGILAVGRMVKKFVPDANEQPVLHPLMTVTLSADHRIVDGAQAARFMADLRLGLEDPSLLVL